MGVINLNDDDGWTEIRLKNKDAPDSPTVVRLDVFRTSNAYVTICEKYPDPVEQGAAWVEYLTTQGLPSLSHAIAFAVAEGVMDEATKLKKTLGFISPSADSPDSTESKPSTDSPQVDPAETSSSKVA